MTLWLVVWLRVSWDCPWGLGRAPDCVKALACARRQEKAWALTTFPQYLVKLVAEAGEPDPLVLEIRGARARRADVAWEPRVR